MRARLSCHRSTLLGGTGMTHSSTPTYNLIGMPTVLLCASKNLQSAE